MNQHEIIRAITHERLQQDLQWGGLDHDRQHAVEDWVDYLEYQISKLYDLETRLDPAQREEIFIKIAALAVAALEADQELM